MDSMVFFIYLIFCLLQMLTDGLWIIGMFLSALFLTAPIHGRASIAETLMQDINTVFWKMHQNEVSL